MQYVEVAVNAGLPQRGSFSYAVPEGMQLQPGDGVYVPFGRRLLQGIVVEVVDVPAFREPKPVEARVGDSPVISAEHVALARWLSEYYLAPLFACVALMLPPGYERQPLTFYESLLKAEELESERLPPRQRAVLAFLAGKGRVEAKQVARERGLEAPATALAQLVQRGLVRKSYGLARPSVRPRTRAVVELAVSSAAALAALQDREVARSERAAAVLRLLLESGAQPATELRRRTRADADVLRRLLERGLIRLGQERVQRDPLAGRDYAYKPAPPLTAEQEAALAPISKAIEARRDAVFLLHGVTGSGKTEVYLGALARALALGRRAIVLVPEIALTPQTVRRFAERFPGRVAVLHSGLSQGELFDQWHGIREGRYGVVIGSRSAVFAPQPDLGLIVIDEEHEWTYKQEDRVPRYHARTAAEQLARLCGATLVLGSATPDVETYQRALWGHARLLQLQERVRPRLSAEGEVLGVVSSTALPPVEVVDMRDELKSGNRSMFSRVLQLALYRAIERGEQAILFLNRRGSAGFLQCRDCGFVPQCPSCAIALGFHRRAEAQGAVIERLLCHQCNRSRRPFQVCPMCGGQRLRPMGIGVEAVEAAVRELLPGVRTARWDRDVTQGRHAHERILAGFLRGEADVLIGTQMVAKGLDLPAVTLVGVVSADVGLHIPDFRAGERTFQLLTQVAGRAGRTSSGEDGPSLATSNGATGGPTVPSRLSRSGGLVIIQTYNPDNYAIVAAAQHDYASFFEQEIELRREQAYPPFVRLAVLIYSHYSVEEGQRRAERLAALLRRQAAVRGLPGVEVLGPAPPHVPRWHGRTRWQITVRSPDPVELLRDLKLGEGWTLDIDPASTA